MYVWMYVCICAEIYIYIYFFSMFIILSSHIRFVLV